MGSRFHDPIPGGAPLALAHEHAGLGLFRLTGRLWGQHRLAENLFFQYEYWWQQAFRQAENHRWLLDSQLKTGLKKGLSAVASLLYTYEPFVPEKVRKRDLFFTFGLQYGLSVP